MDDDKQKWKIILRYNRYGDTFYSIQQKINDRYLCGVANGIRRFKSDYDFRVTTTKNLTDNELWRILKL